MEEIALYRVGGERQLGWNSGGVDAEIEATDRNTIGVGDEEAVAAEGKIDNIGSGGQSAEDVVGGGVDEREGAAGTGLGYEEVAVGAELDGKC